MSAQTGKGQHRAVQTWLDHDVEDLPLAAIPVRPVRINIDMNTCFDLNVSDLLSAYASALNEKAALLEALRALVTDAETAMRSLNHASKVKTIEHARAAIRLAEGEDH